MTHHLRFPYVFFAAWLAAAPLHATENDDTEPAVPAPDEAGSVYVPEPLPVPVPEAAADPAETEAPADAAEPASAPEAEPAGPPAPDEAPRDEPRPFALLDTLVPPGEMRQLGWYAGDSFTGAPEPTPVLVAHGTRPGPVLCLTAAIHGDELNGIEITRQLIFDIDPQRLRGTVIGVPIVNLHGFRQGSRYLPDRRDLNRHFPGSPYGSAASRIAYSLFESIIRHCNALVDLHTGSFHRTNLPQIRADLNLPEVVSLTKGFGATVVLHGGGPVGSIRRAATDADIPAVTLEAGEPGRFQPDEVSHGVRALRSLLNYLDMMPRFRRWGEPQPVYYESQWVRVDHGGILVSRVQLGEVVRKDEVLGTVTDPITNRRREIRSPDRGRVLGMALNQAVIPGFAAYHIGIQRTEEELTAPQEEEPPRSESDVQEAPHVDDEATRALIEQAPQPEDDTDLHLD